MLELAKEQGKLLVIDAVEYTFSILRFVFFLALRKVNRANLRETEIYLSYATVTSAIIIHQIFSLARDWSKRIT